MYATRQNMVDRYGEDELIQLTDRTRSGMIDDGVLDRALADADNEITPYLAGRYLLPFAQVPASLTKIACSIARYNLYDAAVTDRVTADYTAAIKFLSAVAKGELHIGPDTAGAPPTSTDGAQMESGGRIFGRSDSGFI